MPRLLCAFALLIVTVTAEAGIRPGDRLVPVDIADTAAHQFSSGLSTTRADTVYLMGGADRLDGMFQDDVDPRIPDWEGWYGVDLTARTTEIWHIDTFNAPVGGNAAWCGEVFASCGAGDPAEGYGNNYEEFLDWTGSVTDPLLPCNVTVTFDANYDNEPGYDYLHLQYEGADGMVDVVTYNGSTEVGGIWVPLIGETHVFTVAATDYVGAGSDEIHLRFSGTSDGGWSDSDCLWPTAGLAQLDNIAVSGDNGLVSTFDDFETGMEQANWSVVLSPGVGDFAGLWPNLESLDPCVSNDGYQVAFIDDGVILPCTGGTVGTSWTYGPGTYAVNVTGGCLGPDHHLLNEVWSPALEWADEFGNPLSGTHQGALFEFDVYPHLPIGNGLFWVWHLRGSTDGGMTWQPWADDNFLNYGSGSYARVARRVENLLPQGVTHVQLALGVWEMGWIWGLEGTDPTPAPYYDNVSFRIFRLQGPSISTREMELAQDNFPAIGMLDFENPGNNSIRFDMANDIMGDVAARILPGDSITFTVTANRFGSVLNGPPELHYVMKTNPLFDPYRAHPSSGVAFGDTVQNSAGVVVPDRYAFDLPDEGFFFPGDVIHYYIRAEDNVDGDIGESTLPADLSGFGVFPGQPGYIRLLWPSSYIVRGLPTMIAATPGHQPGLLFYNDFGGRGGEDEWSFALSGLGLIEGVDYDVYYVNAPSSGVSNGLGSRATISQIDGYDTILYTSGNLSSYTLNQFDRSSDKSDDLGLLDAWLQSGERNLLATGDNIVSDLITNQGAAGADFVSTWLGVSFTQWSVGPLIGGQTAPMIIATGSHSNYETDLIAYGGCPGFNTFDAVEAVGDATVIAEWTELGAYPYAAGVHHVHAGSEVVYFPVDFSSWYTPPGFQGDIVTPWSGARAEALGEILLSFGYIPVVMEAETPRSLSARHHPNPFNPLATIELTLPRSGPVSLRVYNVKGEMVRTLADGVEEAGHHSVTWNGSDDRGQDVASGVYFYELRAAGEKKIGKMALVR